MSKRGQRVLMASVIGLALGVGGVVALARILRPPTPRYEGRPMAYWIDRLDSPDAAVSSRAHAVLNHAIIPGLVDTMFHDTNDSRVRMALIERLNQLPGVDIEYPLAARRRIEAAQALGTIGPPAKAALPDLAQVVKGTDAPVRFAAATALGQLRSEPETVIPLLVRLLDDPGDGVPEGALEGLGHFGGQAKAVVPRLIALSKSPDKETRHAAMTALGEIDPAAAEKAAASYRQEHSAASSP